MLDQKKPERDFEWNTQAIVCALCTLAVLKRLDWRCLSKEAQIVQARDHTTQNRVPQERGANHGD